MNKHTFKEGQELEAFYLPGGENFIVGENFEKITVVYENGQMGEVPWFAVWSEGKIVSKWNAIHVEGVRIK